MEIDDLQNKKGQSLSENASEGRKAVVDGVETLKAYRSNEDFLLRDIAGEYVLIPTGIGAEQFNGMIVVNETFRFLWELFQTPHTIKEAVQIVAEAYEGDSETIEQDVSRYAEECLQYGFLKED